VSWTSKKIAYKTQEFLRTSTTSREENAAPATRSPTMAEKGQKQSIGSTGMESAPRYLTN
jgi:hypothetical protein